MSVQRLFREECLNQYWCIAIGEARTTIAAWRVDCNTERPHTARHNQTLVIYNATWLQNQKVQPACDEPFRWTRKWVRTNGLHQ